MFFPNGFFAFCLIFQPSIAIDLNSRVLNGDNANRAQFPHHASVEAFNSDSDLIGICSGSVIGRRWILTAASCVSDCSFANVGLGSISYTHPLQTIASRNIRVHQKYDNGNVQFNIALIELESEITFSDLVKPILLWKGLSGTPLNGPIYVTGFGRDENSLFDHLQYARLKLVSSKECKRAFPGEFLCTTGYFNAHQCPYYFDAGAPLIVMDPDTLLYHQIGLFAVMTKHGCRDGSVVGYLDIRKFVDWINGFGVK